MNPLRSVLAHVTADNPYIKPRTLANYTTVINLAEQWTGHALTCDEFFQLDQIKAWVTWLATTPPTTRKKFAAPELRTASTVRKLMLAARTLWRVARRAKLTTNRVAKVKHFPRIKLVKEDPIAWTVAEMNRILEYAVCAPALKNWTGLHWYTILSAYFVTCERHTALLACQPDDLRDNNVLVIRARTTKDGKPGTTMLPGWLADTIRTLPRIESDPRIWQWPFRKAGETMRGHLRSDILIPAGLPHDRYRLFHCLRKAGITTLVDLVGLETASARARHSSPGLTMTSYVAQANLALPAPILGDVIGPPPMK